MFKYYFEQIHNVAIWPMISLSIFFIFFVCLILWVVKVDKSYISEMENLPMDESDHHNLSK
jgi:hypothetical protein